MEIIIVGGGTAGWLTALYAKKSYPKENITLVESSDIGILGAGEGSVPSLISFFDFLEIPFSELVKNCKSTVKNGIKFTNWSKNKSYYFHPFASNSIASNDFNFSLCPNLEPNTSFSHFCAAKNNDNLNDYVFMQKISNKNKVPFFISGEFEEYADPFLNFGQVGLWSMHFDARLLADYLKKVGMSRGIKRVEGLVEKINTDKDGYIESLIVNDRLIRSNFVFDCSGFKRLIIGNFYKSKWKSHSEYLPVNKAIPFFLPKDEDIPPYTESIAMDYGWMWKIPLQHRYGCGYVFDSNQISEDKAKNELDKFLGFEVESPKTFSFNAGCYEDIWIKNCLAVGLSSGFIEPLEATSIFQSYLVLSTFFSSPNNIKSKNEATKKMFNKKYTKETEEIVNFIYLHYITDKNDTDFWKNFKKETKTPDFIDYILSVSKDRPLSEALDFFDSTKIFNFYNYYYVLIGNKILTKPELTKQSKFINYQKNIEYNEIVKNQNFMIKDLVHHNLLINKINKK